MLRLPILDEYCRAPYPELPSTATMAFRFHQGNKLLLFSAGQIYEGDLIEPARWHHIQAGLRVFVRLPGGLETAPIVAALVLANHLNQNSVANSCCLDLDLNPDRPLGQEPAAGEVVWWHRSQIKTLFVYWERAGKVGPKRDTPC
ncbi:hypothetical protein FNT36_14395 [Hymenobacter setariae]|uniref:Uncharacterized protein n=1 Tax=Hymenobacter setariae TaxID=2594794 RepID=A0A558BVV6_9BACT|nr:hypothetical protein [Hymenobacter setariae]TVT40655.1 hypothetical protein FNT36_14395 [Hymenobacter setariae]